MFRNRLQSRQALGLGICFNQRGIGLAQTVQRTGQLHAHPAWHWQAFGPHDRAFSDDGWPDPHGLRWARQRSGFEAKSVAMALPADKVLQFNFPVNPTLGSRQRRAQLHTQLAAVLPWPIEAAVWDYQMRQPSATPVAEPHSNARPAWLHAALQSQASWQAEVLAMPKTWADACAQWCREAGLQLVKLEPQWQASMRWQAFLQDRSVAVLHEVPADTADALTESEWAMLGGLALGAVKP